MDKFCNKCKKTKNFLDFHKDRTHKDGLRSLCKSCIRQYQHQNKEQIFKKTKEYRKNNKEKIRETKRKYRERNRESVRAASSKRQNIRWKTDIEFKLRHIIRVRLGKALKNNQKVGSGVDDLGCSIMQLKEFLEKQFYNHPVTSEVMNWSNHRHDGWHIDHIKPLSSFNLTDRKQFLEACHYTNLQPLWALENLRKGAKND